MQQGRLRVAFAGRSGSGKTTAAEFLQHECGGVFLSFAYPIKRLLRHALVDFGFMGPVAVEFVDLHREHERRFLQFVGTEWARRKDPDVFVKLMQSHIDRCDDPCLIVDDVRFANEAAMLRRNGFRIFRIHRPGQTASKHESEYSVDSIPAEMFDGVIENRGALEDLREAVFAAVFKNASAGDTDKGN